ncbi:hypothetical protein BY458DRAFT_511760 [Sporodiniella umbellata]|nr:hypothetical protein BY458DRAFT_511760 [Sporodiniella umbellata]
MSDHETGSTYAALHNVPVMVSPHYRLPKKITVASELKPVPDSITQLVSYPFSIERQALLHAETSRKKSAEEEENLKAKMAQYEEEKIKQQKVAARKIAPGFLDTDTRILKPEQKHVSMPEAEEGTVQPPALDNRFDYLKFEQGLSPADPWDAPPENDFAALRSVLGSPGTNTINTTHPYPVYPPRNFPKNEGAYWNFQNGATYPQALSPSLVPALPPKLFNTPMPSSTKSSPIIPHTLNSPPPIPPLPNTAYEHLIEELNNMGFSRLQAIDALEKNDHDLIKATNFLLDQA